MPSPSAGQVAYEGYRKTTRPSDWRVCLSAWEDLPALQQEGWEAAAQAVLAWKEEETPC